MCCDVCKEFMYRGTKFNAKKEIAGDMNYLGIHIHRFFLNCPRCLSQIVFRTDPEHADYFLEHGASRNFEPWKEPCEDGKEEASPSELDEIQKLEEQARNSKIQHSIDLTLNDLLERNERTENLTADEILCRLQKKHDEQHCETASAKEVSLTAERIRRIELGEVGLGGPVDREEGRRKLAESTKLLAREGAAQDRCCGENRSQGMTQALKLSRKPNVGESRSESKPESSAAENGGKESQRISLWDRLQEYCDSPRHQDEDPELDEAEIDFLNSQAPQY
eukprot:CAMPEP_0181307344 /NCGR_PEP_ID=MMETSP1101-20121128/10825_1 /TAXON_ID=46948 /ORGANISM="Rhodomonas abbreviata, Strain Caron Lab Isolate" /LENGTH=278 /DNA_ID=CAMNT_0023413545 /DNA_START=228 /DNA_END=1064 /DNA_ORIENTATION=-